MSAPATDGDIGRDPAFLARAVVLALGVVCVALRFGGTAGLRVSAAAAAYVLLDLAQARLPGWSRPLLAALQVAAIAALFLAPAPLGFAGDLPMPTIEETPFLFVLLCLVAATATPPRPLVTLAAGTTAAAAWTLMRFLALADPRTITKANIVIARYKTPLALIQAISGPHYFNTDIWRVNLIILSVVVAALVLSAFRTRRLAARSADRQAARDALSAYFSPQVVELILAGGAAGLTPQTREVAVLDCDLAGFTGLASALAPEKVAETLRLYRGIAEEAVQSRGGAIVSHEGDGLRAVFGLTHSGEGAAAAAEASARQMLAEWPRRAAELLRDKAPALAIGIDFGPARVGLIGKARTLTLLLLGAPVKSAAALQAATRGAATPLLLSEAAQAELARRS